MATIACIFTLIVKSVAADDLSILWNLKTLTANFLLIFSGWPYFSMIGINNPTWYLCVLIQCYIVFYLIRWISDKTGVKRFWFDALVIVFAFGLHFFNLLPDSTYRGLVAFSIGLIISDLMNRVPKNKLISFGVMIVGFVFVVLMPSQQRRIMTFMIAPAAVMISVWWDGITSEKSNEVISTLGKMSFEVFIWHYPLMAMEQTFIKLTGFELSRSYITMMAFTILVWLIAYPLYRYVEIPLNRFIRKMTT